MLFRLLRRAASQPLCPHCLHSFVWKDVLFRCSAPSTVCAPEKDATYGSFFGNAPEAVMPPLTPAPRAAWQGASPVLCRACATPTTQQACPTCHGYLPPLLREARLLPIALVSVDPTQAHRYVDGLTSYLKRIGAHDLGATLKEASPLEGFLLEFPQETGQKPLLTVFYAVAPQDFHHPATQHLLKPLRGFIVLHSGSFLCEGEANDAERLEFVEMMQEITRYFTPLPTAQKPPVAVALTGLERWGEALLYPSIMAGGLAPTSALSRELSAYLGAVLGVNFLREIKSSFEEVRYFALSTHVSDKIRDHAGVDLPFRWIMGR